MKYPRHLHRISAALYSEPWLIRAEVHHSLHRQLQEVLRHGGQPKMLGWDPEDDDDDCGLPQRQADMDCLACLCISDGIAIVPVSGIVGKHLDLMETLCGGYDLALLQQQCFALMNRADVDTVIFSFNTPGGRASAVEDTAAVILALGAMKRTIAWCDDACSAGYWLAAACAEIYCGASSTLGSIGTVCAVLDESKAYEMEGLAMQVFTDGPLKGAGMEGTSLTPAQRTDIQNRVTRLGDRFKSFITSRRGAVAPETMQGQFFYGEQGLELGLADAIAPTLEHVVALALG